MLSSFDCDTILFADDSTFIIHADNTKDLEDKANKIMIELEKYLNNNHMFLNIDKTHFISFNNIKLNINFNNTPIKQVEEAKLLGLIIDRKLKFKHQLKIIAQSMYKSLPIFYKYRKTPFFVKKILFSAFILSHINYNSFILNTCNKTALNVVNKPFEKAKKMLFKNRSYINLEHNIYDLETSINLSNNTYILKNIKTNSGLYPEQTIKKYLSNRKLLFLLPKKPIKKLSTLYNLLYKFNQTNRNPGAH